MQIKIQYVPIDSIKVYGGNPRKNDHAVETVATAIKEFGFRVPLVAKSNGELVDGHLRLKAALQLGLAEVPVICADDMTEAQIKAFRLSVNKVAELAEWDTELLAKELAELDAMDFDLDVIGFSEDELNQLLNENELDEGNDDFANSESNYTKKISTPIYEIKGDKPEISQVFSTERYKELISNIESSSLDNEIKTFLTYAASRHIKFNYEKIAEYYAHANTDEQKFFRDSALVIVDYDSAIENGYITLTEKLMELSASDD